MISQKFKNILSRIDSISNGEGTSVDEMLSLFDDINFFAEKELGDSSPIEDVHRYLRAYWFINAKITEEV
jgi:hypothetical protein